MWGRLYLTPLLQAEEDRDQVRRYYADKAREKELLGTEHKVYNSDRYAIVTEIQLRFSMDKSMMLMLHDLQLHPPYLRLHSHQGHPIDDFIDAFIDSVPPRVSAPWFGTALLFYGNPQRKEGWRPIR